MIDGNEMIDGIATYVYYYYYDYWPDRPAAWYGQGKIKIHWN